MDNINLKTLNKATGIYAGLENITTKDIFNGITEDEERMTILKDFDLIEKMAIPKQQNVKFMWVIDDQRWKLEPDFDISITEPTPEPKPDPERNSVAYGDGNGNTNINELLDPANDDSVLSGNWIKDESTGGVKAKNPAFQPSLFVKNNNEEYSITSKAALSGTLSLLGGYGIFFESSLDNNSRETGYSLHFNKEKKAIMLVTRNKGEEVERKVLADASTDPSIIKSSRYDDFWTNSNEIKLDVTKDPAGGNKKQLKVSINGQQLKNSFDFESTLSPEDNQTGFRTWGTDNTVFTDLKIEGK